MCRQIEGREEKVERSQTWYVEKKVDIEKKGWVFKTQGNKIEMDGLVE